MFFDTINAYQRTAALKSAIELELFTQIARGRNTAAALAGACHVAERGARILADYLSIIGFLTKEGDRYALTPDTATFLDRQTPAYVGGAVEFLTTAHMRQRFEELSDAVRAGGARDEDNALNPEHEIWVRFARGMAGLAAMPADGLAQRVLASAPTASMRVLDVAAGHGLYGIAFARQNPNASVVASDWGNVLTVAQDNALKAGVQNRHTTIPGSAFDVDWGGGYDVVLLTNFLHHFDRDTCISFLRRVHASLAPGGRAAILEFVPNPDRVTPPTSAAFSMVMLATTAQGDAYTFADLDEMFRNAGFASSEMHALPASFQQVIVSVK